MKAHIPQIIAHRGAWGRYPQNSAAAAAEAVRVGADWVECDVRILGDGTVVVHHNPWRAGRVLRWLDLQSLRKLPGGSEVPTFEAWIKAVGNGAKLLVEIKEPAAVSTTLELLRKIPGDRLIVQSFSQRVLERSRVVRPGLTTCLLEVVPLRPWRLKDRPSMVAISWPYALLGGIFRAHRADMPVRVWVINWPWLARRMAKLGVEGIITDRVAQARSWLR